MTIKKCSEVRIEDKIKDEENVKINPCKCIYCNCDNFNEKTYLGEREVMASCLDEDTYTVLYLVYDEKSNKYYLAAVGEGRAFIEINFCPKCGRNLNN